MNTSTREHLPLIPLLHAYTRPACPAAANCIICRDWGRASPPFCRRPPSFCSPISSTNASATELSEALVRFYEACVQPPLHVETLRRRAGIVRHALGVSAARPRSAADQGGGVPRCFRSLSRRRAGAELLVGLVASAGAVAPSRLDAGHPRRTGLASVWRPGGAAMAPQRSTPPCSPPTGAFKGWSRPCPRCTSIIFSRSSRPCAAAICRGKDVLAEPASDAALRAAIQRERGRLPLRERLEGSRPGAGARAGADGNGAGQQRRQGHRRCPGGGGPGGLSAFAARLGRACRDADVVGRPAVGERRSLSHAGRVLGRRAAARRRSVAAGRRAAPARSARVSLRGTRTSAPLTPRSTTAPRGDRPPSAIASSTRASPGCVGGISFIRWKCPPFSAGVERRNGRE